MGEKLVCALFAILVPEYYLGVAFEELLESRLICLELKKLGLVRVEQRALSPGGNCTPTVQSLPEPNDTAVFTEYGNPETHRTNDQGHNLNVHRDFIKKIICGLWHTVCESWRIVFSRELKRGFYVEMGGFELVSDLGEGEDLPDGFKGRVTSRGAIELARVGLLPEVSLELIEDQSKSDTLAKALVCLQASWMIIQCISRVARSIPLTLLEVHTVVNAICAFLMYLLWFQKPQDVMVPTKVRVDDEKLKKLKDIVEANSPSQLDDGEEDASRGFKLTDSGSRFHDLGVGLSSCRISQPENRQISQAVMLLLVTTIYGGVHLTVWKGHFPTNLERILWIVSALLIMVMPFLGIPIMFVLGRGGQGQVAKEESGWWSMTVFEQLSAPFLTHGPTFPTYSPVRGSFYLLLSELFRLGVLLYIYARLYLVVESFASLRSLPLGSYTAFPWVSLIPHL